MPRLPAAFWLLRLLAPVLCGLLPMAALADSGPEPPCGVTASPSFADIHAPPSVRVWHDGELPPNWTAPGCVGWSTSSAVTLVALSGTFKFHGSGDDLLAGFGAISTLTGMRYWSVGDRGWRELITEAVALEGAKSQKHRADFTIAEMRNGQALYFRQSDSRSSAPVVYRMKVLEATPDRVVVEMENVSAVRLLIFSAYGPGDLKATYFLNRAGNGQWSYYSLSSVHESGISGLGGNHDGSYINRAAAFYRHVIGVPTDQEPPLAPK